jgi:hypothetical protein
MTSNKMSSATKRLLAETSRADQEAPAGLLVRVAVPESAAFEGVVRELGGHVRTRAGDVFTVTLPLSQVDALARLDSVVSVEVAEPLFPDSHERNPGD